jgi:hypothetical protein
MVFDLQPQDCYNTLLHVEVDLITTEVYKACVWTQTRNSIRSVCCHLSSCVPQWQRMAVYFVAPIVYRRERRGFSFLDLGRL